MSGDSEPIGARPARLAQPRELVVLSWGGGWGRALRQCVSDPFTARTGIAVRHQHHVGLDLPASLLGALRTGRRPPFDVVWCNAVPAMRAAREGYCEPFTVDGIAPPPFLSGRGQVGGVEQPAPIAAYVVPYVLVFRRAAFPDGSPTSWRALEDPRHRGKVALYPGGNGIHPVAQLLGGGELDGIPRDMEACWRFLESLRPQVGALDYSVGMGGALHSGALNLCFRALPNAIAFAEQGLDVDWVAPREGVPDTVDTFWVPRHLPTGVADLAKQYVRGALSTPIYDRWCAQLGVMPVRPDVPVPRVLTTRAGLPCSASDPARLLHVPEEVKLNHEYEWRERFDAIFARP